VFKEIPKAKSDPVAYFTSTGTEYLYYIGEDNHIYQLYRSVSEVSVETWTVIDISAIVKQDFKPVGEKTKTKQNNKTSSPLPSFDHLHAIFFFCCCC
jgi:hypothetical protein